MAFSNTKLNQFKFGEMDIEIGTFTNDSTAGGNVDTELVWVEAFFVQGMDTAVIADHDAINETFPCLGEDVAVVTTNNSETYGYIAIGRK